ncbi:hypothetical protein ALC57_03981 [Trachymyrmex cornetzi]|uniref:Uncharacterized protein n=1 Tax=Trachymyrmex cornetzi TaxID=471704 RepID=A0A151JLH4_9HYME|nr:hypothetical protein ALC57_03981 [Trachymyrmex cornetzi]
MKMGEEGGMREWLKEMREEMREGLKGVRKEIREVAEGQKEWMRKEVERIKEEIKEKEERWMREMEEMKEWIKALERQFEWREREERKKNIMVKGVKVEEGKIYEDQGGVRIERIRKLDGARKEKGCAVVVTLGSVEDKGKIMRNKWRMKGKDIWIEEDLSWNERKMRGRMRRVVMKKGGRARMGQGGGVWIEGE